ncbi:MAG: hypothetical protein PHX51_06560 [Clostridia bacterium]|nr:hypothetical protein [Clostridia bacterium]
MIENGFYKLSDEYINLVVSLGGKHDDRKTRPIFCCIKDKYNPDIWWAIPCSDLSHRSSKQIDKYNEYCLLDKRDIRSSYYHIGFTDRPALFKISSAFPITDKYISGEYTSKGAHLLMKDEVMRKLIQTKLRRILLYENNNPNVFENKKTLIYNYLDNETKLLKEAPNKDKSFNELCNKAKASAELKNKATEEKELQTTAPER